MDTRDESDSLYDSVSAPKKPETVSSQAEPEASDIAPGFHPGFGAVPQAPEAQALPGDGARQLSPAEIAARAAATRHAFSAPDSFPTQNLPLTGIPVGGEQIPAQKIGQQPAGVPPYMVNTPVVAAVPSTGTVFGSDLSASTPIANPVASQQPAIETVELTQTMVQPAVSADTEAGRALQDSSGVDEEAEEQAAQRAQEKAERDQRLGTVRTSEKEEPLVIEKPAKPTTDKFSAAFGLLILRIITALIVGVYGYQILTNRDSVAGQLTSVNIPMASKATLALALLLFILAIMLLFGFGTRVAGILVAALAGATLGLFKWGNFSPFIAGEQGFIGDIELLLVAVGLAILLVGAGGWSLDGGIRRSRARRKFEEAIA